MKTALTFIFSFIVSSSGSFAFDTQNGQYLSEQDLIYTLQTIFFKPNLLVWEDSYELQYFNYNSVQFPPQKFYEFGFINLETGEKMTHAPDSNYILTLDLFITKAISELIVRHEVNFRKMVFSAKVNQFFNEKSDSYLGGFASWITATQFSTLPLEIQMQLIEDIAVFIYEDRSLVPQQLLTNIQNNVTQAAVTKNLNIRTSLMTVFKKIIISDQFLKY